MVSRQNVQQDKNEKTHYLAEVAGYMCSDVLLKRALEALIVGLPDSKELPRPAN
jgi:hypothetical protein